MSPTAQHPVLQAPLAHAALAALAVAPLVLPVPTNANIVITAVLTVRQAKERLSLKCDGGCAAAVGTTPLPVLPLDPLNPLPAACIHCPQVLVGCWRSVKPEPPPEAMTKKVAHKRLQDGSTLHGPYLQHTTSYPILPVPAAAACWPSSP